MDRQCTATSKRSGERCKKWAIKGAKTCLAHGSGSKKARAAAARRVEEEKASRQARKAVEMLGIQRDISPSEALLEEVRWTAGHVDWLRDRVKELEREQLVWGKTKEKSGVLDGDGYPTSEVTESSVPSVWYSLYEKERAHLVAVCTAALRAGVEARRVALAEAQGEQVAAVIRAILDDLGLTVEQQRKVATVVPSRLRLLAGGAA